MLQFFTKAHTCAFKEQSAHLPCSARALEVPPTDSSSRSAREEQAVREDGISGRKPPARSPCESCWAWSRKWTSVHRRAPVPGRVGRTRSRHRCRGNKPEHAETQLLLGFRLKQTNEDGVDLPFCFFYQAGPEKTQFFCSMSSSPLKPRAECCWLLRLFTLNKCNLIFCFCAVACTK